MRNYKKIEITDSIDSNVQDIIQDSWSEYDMEMIRLDLIVLSRLIRNVDNVVFELLTVKNP